MSDSKVQLDIEKWIREEWLPKVFGQKFRPAPLKLESGGMFNFDAVSQDNMIVVNISTSGVKTASGNPGSGKKQKLRADMFFLMMTETEKRLIALTEKDMFNFWEAEKQAGRVPREIEFIHVELPKDLKNKLLEAKKIASKEVSP